MAGKSNKSKASESDGSVVKIGGDPDRDVAAARKLHTKTLPGIVYANTLAPQIETLFVDADLSKIAILYAEEVIERMSPRDPLEEMLIGQMLVTHGRVLHLNCLATQQTDLNALRIVNEYVNSHRRG